MVDIPVQPEITRSMQTALDHFRQNGLDVEDFPFGSLQDCSEWSLAKLCTLKDVPLITRYQSDPPKYHSVIFEIVKSIFGKSRYSFAGLFFVNFYETADAILLRHRNKYLQQLDAVRQRFLVSWSFFPCTHVTLSGLARFFIIRFVAFLLLGNPGRQRCTVLSHVSGYSATAQ